MNARRVTGIVITILVLLLLAGSAPTAQTRDVAAEAPRVPQPAPAAQPQEVVGSRPAAIAAQAAPGETFAGAVMAQTFTLQPGWNAIYLTVEPTNPSPLVNEGTADKPQMVHTKSTMEAVFGDMPSGALDSVWTYNQPVSSKDYIVDPGEGLWNEPGWERYVPDTNLGDDGESRGFLTTLHTLHANTGYLVKMNTSGTVTVSGKPVPGHHRWTPGAYNLSGFPILPGHEPNVATFIVGSPLPIDEVRQLMVDGQWSLPMAGTAVLTAGMAYLVRYSDDPAVVADYTAPLDLRGPDGGLASEGLSFKAGMYGNKVKLFVKNLSAGSTDVTLGLLGGSADSRVALHYNDTSSANDLQIQPLVISVPAGGQQLDFLVPTAEQPAAGEGLLQISCANLGTRWLIPISAEPGSYAGLWVGDVVVNDVSEARLGATDMADDRLTIALASANASGVRGAAMIAQNASASLQMTITLALPTETAQTATLPEVSAPYVHGYVFVDANQNGQHDTGEAGLANVPVSLSGGHATTTQADGSYWLSGLSAAEYSLSAAPPEGYTSAFTVTIPAPTADIAPTQAANALPMTVTLTADGATAATPSYLTQVLPSPHALPFYDGNEKRVEPALNFGYVRADTAWLRIGPCDQPRGDPAALGTVKNGQLLVSAYAGTLAGLVGDSHIYIERNGAAVACGNIVVGAPTAFDDGRGSTARFRLILRVSEVTRDGQTVLLPELLPYYAIDDNQRISAVNFLTLQEAVRSAGRFGVSSEPLEFNLTIPANDPLNPFKHKYSPDHDNLDRKFQAYQETVPQYLYESPNLERRVTLVLTALPQDGEQEAAARLDWGGATWGGEYREVVDGLHKNTITARGYFVIRRVLSAEQLKLQAYDDAGGAQ